MRKKIFQKGCLLCFFILSMYGCKDTIMVFDEQAGLYIHKAILKSQRDSITYNFVEKKASIERDTILVPVKVTGRVVNYDRAISVQVIEEETTAQQGEHYDVLPSQIKANQYQGFIPIVVYKKDDLKTNIYRLRINTLANHDFPLAIKQTKTTNDFNGEDWGLYGGSYLVKITNQVVKPDTWYAPGSWFYMFFGNYSDVKFQFIMEVTGRTVWPPRARDSEEMTNVLMSTYYGQVIQALFLYEKENGPLRDEANQIVTFPRL